MSEQRETKYNDSGNFQTNCPLTTDAIDLTIKQLVYPYEGEAVLFVKEIKNDLNISKTAAYDKVKDGKFTPYEFCVLARRLYERRSDLTLINLVVPEGMVLCRVTEVPTDKTLDDESRDLHIKFGKALAEYCSGDDSAALATIQDVKEIVHRAELTIKERMQQ